MSPWVAITSGPVAGAGSLQQAVPALTSIAVLAMEVVEPPLTVCRQVSAVTVQGTQ